MGNGRLETRPLPVGEPWGDYAVSTARWKGALLHEVLEHVHPTADGVEVRFDGADHGAYHLKPVLAETNQSDLRFVRSLTLAHATDPAAEILIAYEMNGQPLGLDHGAPFRLIVPHWYAVASVKWLKRIDVLTEPYSGEFQTGHYVYEWPDRPHEAVRLMRVRARITDPAAGTNLSRGTNTFEEGMVRHRASNRRPRQLPAEGLAPGEVESRTVRTNGRTGHSNGSVRHRHAFAPDKKRPATSNPTSHPGTGSATETTQSKSPTSTCATCATCTDSTTSPTRRCRSCSQLCGVSDDDDDRPDTQQQSQRRKGKRNACFERCVVAARKRLFHPLLPHVRVRNEQQTDHAERNPDNLEGPGSS